MTVEHIFYGMVDGKIVYHKSKGVTKILTDKSLQFLRNLRKNGDGQYLWFPTEQVIALSRVIEVKDEHGRHWVQNKTLLIPIHDYIQQTYPFVTFKEMFDKIEVMAT